MREAIHAFVDFEEDRRVVDVRCERVGRDGDWRNETEWDAYILGAKERCVQVIILDIDGHPFGVIGNDRVDEEFDGRHGCSEGGGGAVVVDAVAVSSSADAIRDVPGGVAFLFGFGIIVCSVGSPRRGLFVSMYGSEGVGAEEASEFF